MKNLICAFSLVLLAGLTASANCSSVQILNDVAAAASYKAYPPKFSTVSFHGTLQANTEAWIPVGPYTYAVVNTTSAPVWVVSLIGHDTTETVNYIAKLDQTCKVISAYEIMVPTVY